MKDFAPKTGTIDEWNAAYYRLEDYLRAHRVTSKVHQSQIILRILKAAAARHAQNDALSPTELAMEEAFAEVDQWFRVLLPQNDVAPQRVPILGRVGLLMLDATERWPGVFMAMEDLPPEFVRAMEATTVQAGPDLQVSSMVPRNIDTAPVIEKLEQTWEKLSGGSVALVVGAGVLVCLGIIFFLNH
jgi:hypothetical protein